MNKVLTNLDQNFSTEEKSKLKTKILDIIDGSTTDGARAWLPKVETDGTISWTLANYTAIAPNPQNIKGVPGTPGVTITNIDNTSQPGKHIVTFSDGEIVTISDGADGTGIAIKGSAQTVDDLPATANNGDAYLVQADGKLYIWADGWQDGVEFRGPAGAPGDTPTLSFKENATKDAMDVYVNGSETPEASIPYGKAGNDGTTWVPKITNGILTWEAGGTPTQNTDITGPSGTTWVPQVTTDGTLTWTTGADPTQSVNIKGPSPTLTSADKKVGDVVVGSTIKSDGADLIDVYNGRGVWFEAPTAIPADATHKNGGVRYVNHYQEEGTYAWQHYNVDVYHGNDGDKGDDGDDGITPTVTTAEVNSDSTHLNGGTQITFTYAAGDTRNKTYTAWNGNNGDMASFTGVKTNTAYIDGNGVSTDLTLSTDVIAALEDVTGALPLTGGDGIKVTATDTAIEISVSGNYLTGLNIDDTTLSGNGGTTALSVKSGVFVGFPTDTTKPQIMSGGNWVNGTSLMSMYKTSDMSKAAAVDQVTFNWHDSLAEVGDKYNYIQVSASGRQYQMHTLVSSFADSVSFTGNITGTYDNGVWTLSAGEGGGSFEGISADTNFFSGNGTTGDPLTMLDVFLPLTGGTVSGNVTIGDGTSKQRLTIKQTDFDDTSLLFTRGTNSARAGVNTNGGYSVKLDSGYQTNFYKTTIENAYKPTDSSESTTRSAVFTKADNDGHAAQMMFTVTSVGDIASYTQFVPDGQGALFFVLEEVTE